MMRADIHTAHKKQTRKRYRILRGTCQGKRPLERYGDINPYRANVENRVSS
jgi:hypothetical protein